MDNFRIYTQATTASLAGLGLPLLISPSLVVWMVSSTPHALTAMESYLARGSSISLLLSAFLILLCSGELKLLYGGDHQAESLPDESSPIATITLISTLFYHFTLAIMLYTYGLKPELSYSLMTLGGGVHLLLGVAGLLIVVFKGDGKVSKRTGADKRTSGFIFKNTESVKKHS